MKKWKNMGNGKRAIYKAGAVGIVVFLAVGIVARLYPTPKAIIAQRAEAQKAQQQEEKQYRGDWIINNLSVVKDPRKDLCIGYIVGGNMSVQSMFYVPCELAPPQIITTGKVVEKKIAELTFPRGTTKL